MVRIMIAYETEYRLVIMYKYLAHYSVVTSEQLKEAAQHRKAWRELAHRIAKSLTRLNS